MSRTVIAAVVAAVIAVLTGIAESPIVGAICTTARATSGEPDVLWG